MAIRWTTTTPRLGSPRHNLNSGAIPVGYAQWNQTRSRGDGPENQHVWELLLPGNPRKGKVETLDQAKAACELAFAEWCGKAQLS